MSYHHGNLKEALIEAAGGLLSEAGVAAVTIRKTARRAGVSHNAVYRHFTDKEALLAEVASEGFRRLKHAMEQATADTGAPAGRRIEAAGLAYVEFALGRPAEYGLMFGPDISGLTVHQPLEQASREAFGVLLDLVRQGQASGELETGDPTPLALLAWSTVHGLSTLLVDRRLWAPTPTELARTLTGLVLSGIRRRG